MKYDSLMTQIVDDLYLLAQTGVSKEAAIHHLNNLIEKDFQETLNSIDEAPHVAEFL